MRSFRKYVHVVNILCNASKSSISKDTPYCFTTNKTHLRLLFCYTLSWKDGFVYISNEILDILYCDDGTLLLTGER